MVKLPQITGKRLTGALKKANWYIDCTHGSHTIMRNEQKPGIKSVIPVHNKPIKPGTLSSILKIAGLTIEEIKALLLEGGEMLNYTVILVPEEDGGYSVEVPALPGCFTQGETREEAIVHASCQSHHQV
ncbi:MAG: type II toxin-antitoxin system HicA family toxin [Dehalococcoidales bacterium]|nr:type II toxin-antitoxin system HicA family toxin [Dehalococcoidales bacterium]